MVTVFPTRPRYRSTIALSILALISFLSLAPTLRALPLFESAKSCCIKHACCIKHSNRSEWRANFSCGESCGCDLAVPVNTVPIVASRVGSPSLMGHAPALLDWVRFDRLLGFHPTDSPRPPPSLPEN